MSKFLRYTTVQDEVNGRVNSDEPIGDVIQSELDVLSRAIVVWKYGIVDEQNGHGRLTNKKHYHSCYEQQSGLVLFALLLAYIATMDSNVRRWKLTE